MSKNMVYMQVTPDILISTDLRRNLGIAPHEELTAFDLGDVILVHKEPLTAAEKLGLADSLTEYAAELLEEVDDEDSECDGDCDRCDEGCPCRNEEEFRIPVDLLRKAGIPAGAHLFADTTPDGRIVIYTEKEAPASRSVTPEKIDLMRASFQSLLAVLDDLEAEAHGI